MGAFLGWLVGDGFLAVASRAIWAAAVRYVPRIVAQVLLMFGISVALRHFAAPDVKGFLAAKFAGLSPVAAELMGYLKVDIAISIIISALIVRIGSSISLTKRTTP